MIMLALLVVDRFDLSLAFQVWVSMFMRALDARMVSNNENDWASSRESALEYLARGRLMDMVARFCDGVSSGVGEQAAHGLSLVRGDVAVLTSELDALFDERSAALQARMGELGLEGGEKLRSELARVLELTATHRAWFGAAGGEDPTAPPDTEIASARHFSQQFVTPSHDPEDPVASAQAHAARFYRPG